VRAYVGGWRARIGLIYPSSGKRDQDFQQLAPDGVTVHITRVALSDPADLEHIGRMSETRNLVAAARLLADLRPDCISWADTSGSFMFGPNGATEQVEAIRRATGVPASTTSTAVLLALRRLRVRRVAVASPYIDEVNRKLVEFFTSHDFEIGRLGVSSSRRRAPSTARRRRPSIDSRGPRGSTVRRRCSSRAPTSRQST
jgi:maleate isomerase